MDDLGLRPMIESDEILCWKSPNRPLYAPNTRYLGKLQRGECWEGAQDHPREVLKSLFVSQLWIGIRRSEVSEYAILRKKKKIPAPRPVLTRFFKVCFQHERRSRCALPKTRANHTDWGYHQLGQRRCPFEAAFSERVPTIAPNTSACIFSSHDTCFPRAGLFSSAASRLWAPVANT